MKSGYENNGNACYGWIRKQLTGCTDILDAGCGDGTLIGFLSGEGRRFVGIDPDEDLLDQARRNNPSGSCTFKCCRFADFTPESRFDAVIFADSLHHMEMRSTLRKAVSLLKDGGKIIVVGLADPTTLKDHLVEGLRVIHSGIVSRLSRSQASVDSGTPVCSRYPEMGHVRRIASEELPGARIRLSLHYRYLLTWQKKGDA